MLLRVRAGDPDRHRTSTTQTERPSRSDDRLDDRGTTLIEIVVTITLLVMVVVPLMAAVRTSIHASSVSRAAAKAETAIVNAADRINRAPQSCDYTVFAEASAQTQGWDPHQATVAHEWYNPLTNSWVPGGCRFAAPTDDLVQKVTITVRTPEQNLARTIQVVKSNV